MQLLHRLRDPSQQMTRSSQSASLGRDGGGVRLLTLYPRGLLMPSRLLEAMPLHYN